MNVSFNKRDPIYLQVMQYFKRLIVSGELNPGSEMPSRRQLANQLKINPNTVQRAYSEMEDQRLIYTETNRPSRVTEDPSVLNQLKKEWLHHAVSTFVAAIEPIDIPLNDVVHLIEEKMHTRKKDKQ
ncbi:transcriptional regulator, GntR family [Alkalibacterium subtropicum]|uniref:Transcriptional regulator, GntR family n=1 Tax=Alkalibacterium subtropicum TaxID=753702 RepID=A0A1I1JPY8_9LACT|nr:GntR family transcriptional regulator [Alkalibacterium subtropicum]SFC50556.1 transcriptional regulator, GntR family [Alkalibacterium subtropicum]